MSGFPVNPSITVARADRIISAIRGMGETATILKASSFGMTEPEMIQFIARNKFMWTPDKSEAA